MHKRSPEPLLWLLFSAGGVASALFVPILVLLFGDIPTLVQGTYTVRIMFKDAPGVGESTPVRKSGILIGRVTDVDFAPDGRQEISLGTGSTALHAMSVDPDGRLLVAGRTWTPAGASEFLALRFAPLER